MKKILSAALLVTGLVSSAAFAGGAVTAVDPVDVQLTANGFIDVGDVDTDINLARQYQFLAVDNRAGFVKNDFEGTLSANVIAGVQDVAADNRFGVVAGSNKGYNVFTGSSVGGSVSACGAPIAKGTEDLGASLVVTGTLVLANANGCNRAL